MVPDCVLEIEIVAAVTGPEGSGCAGRAGTGAGPLEALGPEHPNSQDPAATAPRVLQNSRRDRSRAVAPLPGACFFKRVIGVHASCTAR